MAEPRRFTYRIDHAGIIRYVNAEFLQFAVENDSPHLVQPGVLGQPLTNFISGQDVRDLYDALFDKVRRQRAVVCLTFRCDGLGLRRFMDMVMRPSGVKGIEFNCRVLREEPRPPVALLAPTPTRSDRLVTMCSWCRRISNPPDWLEIEDAINQMRLFEQHNPPQIIHSVCYDCAQTVRLSLDQ